jgi:hypothetical protein
VEAHGYVECIRAYQAAANGSVVRTITSSVLIGADSYVDTTEAAGGGCTVEEKVIGTSVSDRSNATSTIS